MALFSNAPKIDASPEERNDHLAFTADQVRKELWAVQLREFPSSVQLTPQQVIKWAYGNDRRMRSVMMAIQNDVSIWYQIPGMGEVTGCRYGWEGSNYISGFSDL